MSVSNMSLPKSAPSAEIRWRVVAGGIVPVILLVIWEVTAVLHVAPDFISSPSAIVLRAWELAVSGQLWLNASASLFRALGGWAVGGGLGIALGCIAGHSRIAGLLLDPVISLVYPVPKIAFLPILIVWLGLGDASKIAAVALSVFFPVFINAFNGSRSVRRTLIWAAKSMGASRARIFFRVVLPAAVPSIFGGVRIGLGLSFIVIFAAELVGARRGLGYLISLAETNQQFDAMFVGIVTIALLGLLCDRLLLRLQKFALDRKTE